MISLLNPVVSTFTVKMDFERLGLQTGYQNSIKGPITRSVIRHGNRDNVPNVCTCMILIAIIARGRLPYTIVSTRLYRKRIPV
jgi:hypothetical protein